MGNGTRDSLTWKIIAGILTVTLVVTLVFLFLSMQEAGKFEKALKREITRLQDYKQALRKKIDVMESEARKAKLLVFEAKDIDIQDIRQQGNEITGNITNNSDRVISDIVLDAMVLEKGDTFRERFGGIELPLPEGQTSQFIIMMDPAPGEGAQVAVVIEKLVFAE